MNGYGFGVEFTSREYSTGFADSIDFYEKFKKINIGFGTENFNRSNRFYAVGNGDFIAGWKRISFLKKYSYLNFRKNIAIFDAPYITIIPLHDYSRLFTYK